MTKPIVHGQPQSTYVRTARMACIESGVDHEVRPIPAEGIDGVRAHLHSDEYRRKHPFSRMPVLEDGDMTVFETSAICRYLTGRYGENRLVPADPCEAVRMEQWISALNSYVIPDTAFKYVLPIVFGGDAAAAEKMRPVLRAHYETLDAALDGRDVIAGDDISIADILMAPPLHLVGCMPGGTAFFDGLENLGRWWTAISERPSFKDTFAPLPQVSDRAA